MFGSKLPARSRSLQVTWTYGDHLLMTLDVMKCPRVGDVVRFTCLGMEPAHKLAGFEGSYRVVRISHEFYLDREFVHGVTDQVLHIELESLS